MTSLKREVSHELKHFPRYTTLLGKYLTSQDMLDSTNSDPDFNHWWQVLVIWVRPGNYHFPHNENPTRALNTISLKYCLLSTDAIDRPEKMHDCVWSFKVASCQRASLKSTRFSQTKIKSGTFLTEWYMQ